jgi:hypothetical protein
VDVEGALEGEDADVDAGFDAVLGGDIAHT